METPKEKALSLYKEFHHTCNCTIAGTSTIFREIAKNCALICVREQIKSARTEDRKYWEEVKKELNNVY